VATPSHRMTAALRGKIVGAVLRAAQLITTGTGGKQPAGYAETVRKTLSLLPEGSA
jgi:hypothetical protein